MQLKRLDTEFGRYYQTPDGIFPSVTTVLSSIPNPELNAWRESIGHEEAEKISKVAAARGTKMHSFCESYLKNEPIKLNLIERSWYKKLTPHLDLIEPIAIEESFWSNKLKVAGTLDCLGKYNGELAIIDFKTTSRLKYNGEFDNYCLQTASYSAMVYERLGLMVPRLVILMQNLIDEECYVYNEKAQNWFNQFKAIRNAFNDQSALLSG